MNIQDVLLQGLAQVITDARSLAQPTPETHSPEATLAFPEPAISPSRNAEDSLSFSQAVETGDGSSILSAGEKQIISLFFNDQESPDITVYGHRSQRPVGLGNFIDVRG